MELKCTCCGSNHPSLTSITGRKLSTAIPVARGKSGVRRYQVLRPVDNANYVLIDLEFDTLSQAEALLAAMRGVWSDVQGKIMMNPQARIVEASNQGSIEFISNHNR